MRRLEERCNERDALAAYGHGDGGAAAVENGEQVSKETRFTYSRA